MQPNEQHQKLFADYNLSTMSLFERMTLANMIDDGMLEATPEQMGELGEAMKDKADAYYAVQEELVSRKLRLEMRLKPWLDELSSVNKNIARFNKRLTWISEQNGYSHISGHDYVIENRNSEAMVIDHKPVQDLVSLFRQYINVEYTWKKKEMKEALKNDPDHELSKFGKIKINRNVKIRIKKGK